LADKPQAGSRSLRPHYDADSALKLLSPELLDELRKRLREPRAE
jgi:hypothetical protein